MSANTGIGSPGVDTSGSGITTGLSDNAIPRWDDSNTEFLDSGLVRNPTTGNITTTADIITSGTIQSGVATFQLGTAHAITSAAENVTFRNIVTDTVFHPTWQTSVDNGTWASVQRTPVGDLIADFVFQADGTQTVTNPSFDFTSIPTNNRLYRVMVEPTETVNKCYCSASTKQWNRIC